MYSSPPLPLLLTLHAISAAAAVTDPTTRAATAAATAPMIINFTRTMGPSLGDMVISSISDDGATEGFGESGVVVVVDATEVLGILGTVQEKSKVIVTI